MAYYKILSCDDYQDINATVLHWVTQLNIINSDVFWNPVSVVDCLKQVPALSRWLVQQKLAVKTVALTVGKKHDCCGPHRDTPPARFKLSWPILNTSTTWNRFYLPNDGSCSFSTNTLGGESWSYVDIKEIDRVRVEKPMLIDAGTIHDVWCEDSTQFPRLGFQMQLINEPVSL